MWVYGFNLTDAKKPLRYAVASLVTPRRVVMNYLKMARELMPVMMGWNGGAVLFLKRPRALQQVAVTY
ncbi:hypothetical protein A2348_02950 [Candidatus Uhrbacteria bacterium RIFOXYB12_FULL_58_10]|uniref:Uncharacterized protein n=1 Tax=Candidatus Uhrbacteria bacterium RIFOXYB2_FULL_57_15 TaxID=1802422 RepID=A0A1F7W6K0_9BACT|nr:MAG: hypothetical protein A2348_02950 [Candidatus Uhrbacteria bacterium RIFOXYB12_FULL_58_10]OGL98432.1 MAG: hypothetical protein A2304_01935 [Candidatus Uhrbacteria bacterium RIFOXYB2_FULL_57_15]OGL99670.1 MAG: hypothetical protein A2501_03025 [Candidatus Uhrbacteria bacterium RIFOXYC12_FULL_57_11]